MKIAVIGVGAIGGYVGTRLALAGEDVTFIARGANLEALQARGIRLILADGSEEAVPRVKATADYAAAGPQDLVILGMKAHQVAAVAADVPKLFGPNTVVVPMQNGIPYWYFHAHGGPLEIDALLGAVIELARLTDTPALQLNTVYTLTRLLQKSLEESRVS